MKSIFVFLFFLSFSIFALGQNNFSIKPFPKIEFDDCKYKADTSLFGLNHKSPLDSILGYYQIPGLEEEDADLSKLKELYLQYYSGNMPIAKPGSMNWNMPIAVPDTRVHFFIQNPMLKQPATILKK